MGTQTKARGREIRTVEDLPPFVEAGYTFFTVDPGAHVDNAADSDEPRSTSSRTSPATPASTGLSVWSVKIASARINESPELIIVANWRDITARSLSFTLSPKPGIFSSFFMPPPAWEMLTVA